MSIESENTASAVLPKQKVNPEIDAKLNAFIADNPALHEAIKALPREQLERKIMLSRMFRQEKQAREFDKKFGKLHDYAKNSGDERLIAKVNAALANEDHPVHQNKRVAAAIINRHAAAKQLQTTQQTSVQQSQTRQAQHAAGVTM